MEADEALPLRMAAPLKSSWPNDERWQFAVSHIAHLANIADDRMLCRAD